MENNKGQRVGATFPVGEPHVNAAPRRASFHRNDDSSASKKRWDWFVPISEQTSRLRFSTSPRWRPTNGNNKKSDSQTRPPQQEPFMPGNPPFPKPRTFRPTSGLTADRPRLFFPSTKRTSTGKPQPDPRLVFTLHDRPPISLVQRAHAPPGGSTLSDRSISKRALAHVQRDDPVLKSAAEQVHNELEMVLDTAQQQRHANRSTTTILASDLTVIPVTKCVYEPLMLLHIKESFEIVMVHRERPPAYCRHLFRDDCFRRDEVLVLFQCKFCHGTCQASMTDETLNAAQPFVVLAKHMLKDPSTLARALLLASRHHWAACSSCSNAVRRQLNRARSTSAQSPRELLNILKERCHEWITWLYKRHLRHQRLLEMIPPARHIEFWVPCPAKYVTSASSEPDRKRQKVLTNKCNEVISPAPHPAETLASENDVLFGYDDAWKRPGNRRLRRHVTANRARFRVASRVESRRIVSYVVHQICDRGGRFLLAGADGTLRGLSEKDVFAHVETSLQRRGSSWVMDSLPGVSTSHLGPGGKVLESQRAPMLDLISGRVKTFEPQPSERKRATPRPGTSGSGTATRPAVGVSSVRGTTKRPIGNHGRPVGRSPKKGDKWDQVQGRYLDSGPSAPVAAASDNASNLPHSRPRGVMVWDIVQGIWVPVTVTKGARNRAFLKNADKTLMIEILSSDDES